jgi:hypothetical protein
MYEKWEKNRREERRKMGRYLYKYQSSISRMGELSVHPDSHWGKSASFPPSVGIYR